MIRIDLKDALRIVVDLARQNVLEPSEEAEEETMQEQLEAIDTVERTLLPEEE